MRLLLDATVRPETVGRLRELSPDLEVVDVSADDAFDVVSLADPDVEILISSRAPSDLARVPSLRWLQVRSAGVDHMAADPPWEKGLTVTNARGVYSIPIAEYVSGMVLRVHQPAAWATDQAAHHWPPESPLVIGAPRHDRSDRRLRVHRARGGSPAVGARDAHPGRQATTRGPPRHRLPRVGNRRPRRFDPGADRGRRGLTEAAASADVMVLTMPLTDASRGIIDADVLAALPPTAWLVNVSRGALVDEPALLEALRGGRLAGAVLDVFGQEPLPADSPWWDAPNVIVTPHASGVTLRFFDELIVENVRRYLAGERLLNRVDPQRGY